MGESLGMAGSPSHEQAKSTFFLTHKQEFFAKNQLQIWTQHPQKHPEMGGFKISHNIWEHAKILSKIFAAICSMH